MKYLRLIPDKHGFDPVEDNRFADTFLAQMKRSRVSLPDQAQTTTLLADAIRP